MATDMTGMLEPMDGAGEWCIVRWLDGRFCGPLSPLSHSAPGWSRCGYGFPGGGVGEVVTFSTADEARAFADGIGNPTAAVDTPMRMADLHFSTKELSFYNGKERVLYDGGEFKIALLMAYARRGQLADDRSAEVNIECRPAAGMLCPVLIRAELPEAPKGGP